MAAYNADFLVFLPFVRSKVSDVVLRKPCDLIANQVCLSFQRVLLYFHDEMI